MDDLQLLLGFGLLVAGGEALVELTVIAVGASLPAPVPSAVAALVTPLGSPAQIAQLDIWVVAGAPLALIVTVIVCKRIARIIGFAFWGPKLPILHGL